MLGPKYRHSVLIKILQLDKLEGADFKYEKTLLKFYPKIT